MSTNYYIVHRTVIDGSVPLEWARQVHIAQYAAGGFLLQAVRGETPFERNDFDTSAWFGRVVVYYAGVSDFPTIEDWATMRAVIRDTEQFAVVDEYGEVQDTETFIERVENNERGNDVRHHAMTDWLDDPRNAFFANRERTDYLDDDGFAFEVGEFS